jgi:hypothetical protein
MNKMKQVIVALALVLGIGVVSLAPTSNVAAINVFKACSSNSATDVCKASGDSAATMIQTVIKIALTVLGMISILMIVIGGVRYTLSTGDSTAVKNAKDTVLYSVVGLVVAIMSYAIVHFVIGYF